MLVQGYLVGRPMEASGVLDFVRLARHYGIRPVIGMWELPPTISTLSTLSHDRPACASTLCVVMRVRGSM